MGVSNTQSLLKAYQLYELNMYDIYLLHKDSSSFLSPTINQSCQQNYWTTTDYLMIPSSLRLLRQGKVFLLHPPISHFSNTFFLNLQSQITYFICWIHCRTQSMLVLSANFGFREVINGLELREGRSATILLWVKEEANDHRN